MVEALLAGSPYVGYAYGYPHKTAYRPLMARVPLAEAWRAERKDALSLYLHVPFCEMRCGFCNLFTDVRPGERFEEAYLATLARQAEVTREALGEAAYARVAIGGGTPTQLGPEALARLLEIARRMGGDPARVPASVETSPETATGERLAVLRAAGVRRVSLGVQSFLDEECRALGRPQRRARVEEALAAIRAAGFPVLNVDLIYGAAGLSEASFRESLDAALGWGAEELYLYPLYVRPLTGLGKRTRSWDDERLALYRAGRERLLERGYAQVSMRLFRSPEAPAIVAPEYSCQSDGMVGLGCGARSYTARLHYSEEFAVGARGVREILAAYVTRPDEELGHAFYGAELDDMEQRRRFVILSILSDGLDERAFAARFGDAAADPTGELAALEQAGLAERRGTVLRLTAAGVERSDAIGPWLFSPRMRERMEGFALR